MKPYKTEDQISMITEIGIVAGEIWRALDDKDELPIAELIDVTHCSRDLILMAAGWLAREAHITIKHAEGDYWMKIRRRSS